LPEFTSRGIKPLDFFAGVFPTLGTIPLAQPSAVEYNEDLSAFHGPTLDVEREYATRAISYILSLYPRGTSIIVMGHSMGGVVATSLLPSPNISAVVTMSTPHKIPPARFDRRIAAIYKSNQAALNAADTPILSLCGGATDLMVPSESCILPEVTNQSVYRRTIFSSALEGSWTGVGHQVMVWCHQVRWRVARAALELGATSSTMERSIVLDRWLRDGRSLIPASESPARLDLSRESFDVLPPGRFALNDLRTPRAVYLTPVPEANHPIRFVAYVSQGSVLSMAPHYPSSLSVTFYLCSASSDDPHDSSPPPACEDLHPTTLKLIPNVLPERPFPSPHEGVDESEGVVVFEAALPERSNQRRWVAIAYSINEERGWILGNFVRDEPITVKISNHGMCHSGLPSLKLRGRMPRSALQGRIHHAGHK
jgi:GPI inositol-deacylase